MVLDFSPDVAVGYHSNSQRARVLTEDWVTKNMFCPICGNSHVCHFEDNRPVADFFCERCGAEFELKSKEGQLGRIISDGAYHTMIERIISLNNPNFFFMTHSGNMVTNLMMVPRFFFTPDVILQRKPLRATARRSGWVGCNIDFGSLPDSGKIFIVKESRIIDEKDVLSSYSMASKLHTDDMKGRGWLLDTLKCVEAIGNEYFGLRDVYSFETELRIKHPENNL